MVSAPHTTLHHCPECGLRLTHPTQTGGLCPRCLIATVVEHLSTVDHPALGRFGAVGATPDLAKLNAQLPAYEFVELLGRGGAGWVFRARQRSLNRPVAIKILHSAAAGIADTAQRFIREGQILARLNHPRIVTVHDYGSLAESQFIVMEYVPGPTLRDVLRTPAAGTNTFRIADQICEAVEYAHSMGVLHRDLKPENVLFESFDNLDSLKVADFGISRLIGDTEPGFHQTQTGFVVGTPFYAAPEQMTADGPIDTRADIYSIGVMLYEMLAGQLPRGRFAPPSHHRKIPSGADAVVLRCLDSDPERRYTNVASLRAALRDVASGAARRRRMLKSAALSAIAAVIVACAWPLLSNRGTTEVAVEPAKPPESLAPVSRPPAEKNTIATAPKQVSPTPTSPPPAETPHEKPTPLASQPPALPPSSAKPPVASAPPQSDALRPLPPPANTTQPEKSTPPSPTKDEDYFDISSVRVYGFPPASLEFRITGKKLHDDLTLRDGANLVWVIQTDGVHRIDSPFKMDPQTHAVSIAEKASLDFHDAWPLEIFIAERWYSPHPGSRRLSNIVRVKTTDVRAEPPPSPRPASGKTVLLQPDNAK
jgi:serine/threonine protein kinase